MPDFEEWQCENKFIQACLKYVLKFQKIF